MRALIPYKKENAKSRLSPVMGLEEREEFVELMLRDVVNTLCESEIEAIDILTPSEKGVAEDIKANIVISELGLNDAINEYLKVTTEPVLIIMADLPLVKSHHIQEITSNDRDIVIAPGKGGGTNILFINDPSNFHVKYHGSSFLTHCQIAKDRSHTLHIYDSFMTGTDIDEPQDLVEIIIHGQGFSKDYIENKFGTQLTKGRVKLCSIA